jgi:hypothetical protein
VRKDHTLMDRHCYPFGKSGHAHSTAYFKVPIVVHIWPPYICFSSANKNWGRTEVSILENSGTGTIGRHNKSSNWLRSAWVPKEPASTHVRALIVRVSSLLSKGESHGSLFNLAGTGATMTIPRYVNEVISDIRGIKRGWYAMDDDGKPSSGPFSSHKECLSRGTQLTTKSSSSKFTSTAPLKRLFWLK